MDKETQEQLYDPKKTKGTWLNFVKKHKHMRNSRGMLDLKGISKLYHDRAYDPGWNSVKSNLRRTYDLPKRWFSSMVSGIRKRSDVPDPLGIVKRIWSNLSDKKKVEIINKERKGASFKHILPLPEDKITVGPGTVRMVKPFNLAEVQVNLRLGDYLHALKSGIFSKMKRQDGTTALVARCKSKDKNVNVFIDKAGK